MEIIERTQFASDADVDPGRRRAHPETDQFLRLDAGSGRVQMGVASERFGGVFPSYNPAVYTRFDVGASLSAHYQSNVNVTPT
jgi:hypothetical protein